MKQDIQNKADIIKIVDTFYTHVRANEHIGYFFNEVVNVDWEHHLPKMYDFWDHIVFHTGNYSGNPMLPHFKIHEKSPMTAFHFQTWLQLFTCTVDELYAGKTAEYMKERANSIALLMRGKVLQEF